MRKARTLMPLLGGAALSAMLFASRLPPPPAFLLPRRGGFRLYRAAWALLATPRGRTAFSVAVSVVLLAFVLLLMVRLWRIGRTWFSRLLGLVVAAGLAADVGRRVLDLLQLAWFPYGSMSPWEPLCAFALFSALLACAFAAAEAFAAARRSRALALAGLLLAIDALTAGLCAASGVGRAVPRPSASAAYVVLTETPEGPAHQLYVTRSDAFSGEDLRPLYRALAARRWDARALPALRALYEDDVKRWDVASLRRDLLLGARRGDALAPILLLTNLDSGAPSPEARAALDAVADERAYRVGPLGAMAIARVYARLGVPAQAKAWSSRPGGIPAGLLGLNKGEPFSSGRVGGVLRAPGPARVALYRRSDPSYLLDASGLVASVRPDARGRFSFSGLPAGRYYLAFAFPASSASPRVSGQRGDLELDAAHPAADAGVVSVLFTAR